MDVNWKKDRFLKKFYIFQEFCYGTHIRVNFFYTKKKFLISKKFIKENIVPKIKKIVTKLELTKMIVKFDIIINKKNDFYFLDLGIDPPYRMRREYLKKKINFEKLYVSKYLLNTKNCFRY